MSNCTDGWIDDTFGMALDLNDYGLTKCTIYEPIFKPFYLILIIVDSIIAALCLIIGLIPTVKGQIHGSRFVFLGIFCMNLSTLITSVGIYTDNKLVAWTGMGLTGFSLIPTLLAVTRKLVNILNKLKVGKKKISTSQSSFKSMLNDDNLIKIYTYVTILIFFVSLITLTAQGVIMADDTIIEKPTIMGQIGFTCIFLGVCGVSFIQIRLSTLFIKFITQARDKISSTVSNANIDGYNLIIKNVTKSKNGIYGCLPFGLLWLAHGVGLVPVYSLFILPCHVINGIFATVYCCFILYLPKFIKKKFVCFKEGQVNNNSTTASSGNSMTSQNSFTGSSTTGLSRNYSDLGSQTLVSSPNHNKKKIEPQNDS